MRRTFLSLLLFAAVCSITSCAFMSDEDKDFYGKGWVHPTDLDQEPMHHPLPPDPSQPAQASTAASSQLPITNSSTDPQWIVPETH